jgi:hypothetical protein
MYLCIYWEIFYLDSMPILKIELSLLELKGLFVYSAS